MEQSGRKRWRIALRRRRDEDGKLLAYAAGVITKEMTPPRRSPLTPSGSSTARPIGRRSGETSAYKADELLALAITGWLLAAPVRTGVPVSIGLLREPSPWC